MVRSVPLLIQLSAVLLQLGGGVDEDDDDCGVEVASTILSLRCPLSGSIIKHPVRFKEVGGLVVFDRDTFLQVRF
jgi:hypothetical protein